jgi:hypothetical protein
VQLLVGSKEQRCKGCGLVNAVDKRDVGWKVMGLSACRCLQTYTTTVSPTILSMQGVCVLPPAPHVCRICACVHGSREQRCEGCELVDVGGGRDVD